MITVIATSSSNGEGAALYFSMLSAWDSIPTEPVEPVRIVLDMTMRDMATMHISSDGAIQARDLAPVLRDIQRVADVDDLVIILCKQDDPANIVDIQMSGMFNAILSITDNVRIIHNAANDYITSQGIAAIFELTQQKQV